MMMMALERGMRRIVFFVDAPGIVRAGLKLNGFQDTLRRPVALYPDRGKLYTYAD
jgi:hypothetical protein